MSSLTFSYYRTAKELKELNKSDSGTTLLNSDTTPALASNEHLKNSSENNPFDAKATFSAHVSIPIPSVEPNCSAVISCYTVNTLD